MPIVDVTERNFKPKVVESQIPVLVDFWAPWCAPCKRIAPIIDEIAKEYDGKIGFAKVNIDEAGGVASEFGIMSIPTLIIFKGGKVVEQITGFVSKDQIKKKLNIVI